MMTIIHDIRVMDLEPGDLVTPGLGAGVGIVVVVHTPHPLFPTLALVVWRMKSGWYWFDALDPSQVVGDADRPDLHTLREDRVREALRIA